MTRTAETRTLRPVWAVAFLSAWATGRWARGVTAWLAATISAVLLGVSLTIGFVLAREIVAHPPFPPSQWWVFLHLWRPLLIAGAILVPVLSGPLAVLAVWAIRARRWPRPLADMIAGGVCGLLALAALVVIARTLGPMGDGP